VDGGGDPDRFRVVSFNVKFARDIEGALAALRDRRLAEADVWLLQEMDLTGTERIACALGCSYVFYPAALHPGTGRPLRPFGVAVLSRWPVLDDRKLPLTASSGGDAAQKAAMAATVWIRGRPVRIVNVHLQSGLTPEQMAPQLREALAGLGAAEGSSLGWTPAIVAGDFNRFKEAHLETIAREAQALGLEPVLPAGVKTFEVAGFIELPVQLDHILVRGLAREAAGRGPRRGSDHFPVWAELRLPASPLEPASPPPPGGDPPLICPERIR
jgi:endonuclease/exonuclease/phosphatase family metal-dependent hydrolase